MAKGFKHTGDPTIETTTFDKVEDKVWVVTGIEKVISKDGEPIFSVRSSFGQEELKISFEFRTAAGEQGPACSLNAAAFYGMVSAFGIDLRGVTAKNRLSPEVVDAFIDQINASGKTLSVESKDGWVNYVPNANPPEGMYTVQLKWVSSPLPEGYDFFIGKGNTKYTIFNFEIVGDMRGRPSLWTGAVIPVYMNDPFVDGITQEDGTTITPLSEGCPLWRSTDRGGVPTDVRKWETFIRHFAPDVLEHAWQADPIKSEYGINELLSPQTVIIKTALEADITRVVLAQVYKSKNSNKTRFSFDMLTLDAMNPDEEEIPFEEAVEVVTPFDQLKNYFMEVFPTVLVFDDDDNFTDAGQEWAASNLAVPWKAAGLGKKRPIKSLSPEEITRLLEEFKNLNTVKSDGETW